MVAEAFLADQGAGGSEACTITLRPQHGCHVAHVHLSVSLISRLFARPSSLPHLLVVVVFLLPFLLLSSVGFRVLVVLFALFCLVLIIT